MGERESFCSSLMDIKDHIKPKTEIEKKKPQVSDFHLPNPEVLSDNLCLRN